MMIILHFFSEIKVFLFLFLFLYAVYVVLTAVFIQNCGHGGTAYYIYSQCHYLSYAPALCKFIFYSFCIYFIELHCNELCLNIVLI